MKYTYDGLLVIGVDETPMIVFEIEENRVTKIIQTAKQVQEDLSAGKTTVEKLIHEAQFMLDSEKDRIEREINFREAKPISDSIN